MDVFALALVLVAGVLAGIDVVRSRGQALTSWAALALAVALVLTFGDRVFK